VHNPDRDTFREAMAEKAKDPTRGARRIGVICAAVSLLASAASVYAFSGYAHWHGQLQAFRHAPTHPPEWLTWPYVDRWKVANVVLACAALALATIATALRAQPLAALALILALLVTCLTVPLVI
jgi:hypothetical protein